MRKMLTELMLESGAAPTGVKQRDIPFPEVFTSPAYIVPSEKFCERCQAHTRIGYRYKYCPLCVAKRRVCAEEERPLFSEEERFMGVMAVMDHTGDTKTIWDPSVKDEVDAARIQFNEMKKKGYRPYRVNPETGKKTELMSEFDPHAAAMILCPPMAGG